MDAKTPPKMLRNDIDRFRLRAFLESLPPDEIEIHTEKVDLSQIAEILHGWAEIPRHGRKFPFLHAKPCVFTPLPCCGTPCNRIASRPWICPISSSSALAKLPSWLA